MFNIERNERGVKLIREYESSGSQEIFIGRSGSDRGKTYIFAAIRSHLSPNELDQLIIELLNARATHPDPIIEMW